MDDDYCDEVFKLSTSGMSPHWDTAGYEGGLKRR